MATSINVNKQNVLQLLSSGTEKPFIIPEYQRPYAWTDEQVETLFEDLWEFTATNGGTKKNGTYFLGSIVSFENDNKEQEIIDGQQRITSLFLLLRAIYTCLTEASDKTLEANNFISKIEPAIWRTNKTTGKVDSFTDILLTSRVVNNEGNEILKLILERGHAKEKADDNYSRNYNNFLTLYKKHAAENPLMIYEFIYAVLNQAILLPITADSQDTALTIFSTLNDRGLPLSDADIFKAKIYNNLDDIAKKAFIEQWQDLEEDSAKADESIQSLLYYYMFYIRAENNDRDTTTPALRKYFLADKCSKLYEPHLMEDLFSILNIWKVVNAHQIVDNESWSQNKEVIQALNILYSYPNEFWKYPVVIYYLKYHNNNDFDDSLLKFLHKLIQQLLIKYLLVPTINAVKTDILKLNIAIIQSDTPQFDFKETDLSLLETRIIEPHRNAVRMLLKLLAYASQDTILPDKWEIEHILPQKWQPTFFSDKDDAEIQIKIEHIGNKTPFEKRLNIIAGNGYFAKKQSEYLKSEVVITKELAQLPETEWSLSNIDQRDIKVATKVQTILGQWAKEYDKVEDKKVEPTPEDLAMIEMLKKKGLI